MSVSVRFGVTVSALCLSLVACDSQASKEYLGESLLTLTGKVIIDQDQTQGEIVPALAFYNQRGSLFELDAQIDIVDVEVEGAFPSSFRLDVYKAPPATAIRRPTPSEVGEPPFAVGHITVVDRPYPRMLHLTDLEIQGDFDQISSLAIFEECSPDGSRCYRQELTCDGGADGCAWTSKEGDPANLEDAWTSFGGLSSNYFVIYLEEAAEAGTRFAAEMNGGVRLDAGYHLFSARALTANEERAKDECDEKAYAEALRIYSNRHGGGHPTTFEEEEMFEEQLQASLIELGCTYGDEVYARVGNPSKESITVQIRRDVRTGDEQGAIAE